AGGGGAVGLLLGGILTTYVSWRWVLFVNVPIGILVAAAAPRVLTGSPRRPGPTDLGARPPPRGRPGPPPGGPRRTGPAGSRPPPPRRSSFPPCPGGLRAGRVC